MTPPRKVKLQEIYKTQPKNLYQLNRQKLNFLPAVFLGIFLSACILGGLWYFDPFQTKNEAVTRIQGVREAVSQENDVQSPTQQLQSDSENKTEQTLNDTNIRISTAEGVNCYLTFQTDKPTDFPLKIDKSPQGFWKPTKCQQPNLRFIQILRLNPEEIEKVKSTTKNLQHLDEQDTYAIVYTKDDNQSIYDLSVYVKTLTVPLFKDRPYFNPAAAFDTRRIENQTYYLDNSCQAGSQESCKLWRLNNETGTFELLKKNVAQTGKSQPNELKPGNYLRFASVQTSSQALSFVLITDPGKKYKRIDLDLKTLEITSTTEYSLGDPDFNTFYR
jgi:hypothetical protein